MEVVGTYLGLSQDQEYSDSDTANCPEGTRRSIADALSQGKYPASTQLESGAGLRLLSYCYRFWAIDRSLWDQTHVGA